MNISALMKLYFSSMVSYGKQISQSNNESIHAATTQLYIYKQSVNTGYLYMYLFPEADIYIQRKV